jgi:glycosyltransferase involved in cell wall biosynthesis
MSIKLTLFFTYGVSLEVWKNAGLLKRELRIYEELFEKYDVIVQLVTYGDESDFKLVESIKGVSVLPVYSRLTYRKSNLFRVLQTALIPWKFRSELGGSDIFKTNQMLGGWVALLSHIFFHKPLLTRCGYEIYDAYKFQKKPYMFLWFVWLISWATYKSSSVINVATLKDKMVVKNCFKIPVSRINIRPNWIDTDVFKPFSEAKISNKILFVGRLNPQKNITLLLDSLIETGISIDVFGAGPLRNDLIQYADNISVDANFFDPVPNDKIPAIYNSYSIYVLCSPYEGNPKTLLEAMACGCAVIGTNAPGINSIITHKVNGLLVEENPSSLKAAILELNSNTSLAKKLGDSATRYIKKNNSLEESVLKEFDTYNKLLNKK